MSGKRILIVEDQRLIAADIEATLVRLGYQVAASVASGEDAVRMAADVHPDLVLMDIRLRGEMDGVQAAEAIRARTDVPVIYLTAYADEETLLRARVTSPFGYLVKPFNERELRAAIEIAISKHHTDRLLVEERARRRAAEEVKLLVDGVTDYAIFMLDAAGRVASWNEGAERIEGYTADEIRGVHFSVFFPKEDVDAGEPEATLERARRDGRTECEGWRIRKDGSRFWANVILTAIRDEHGRLHGFGEITRDLTERRKDDLALQESVARTSAVVAAALDCILSMDASGRLTEFNPAAERTFGYTRDEAIGQEMARLIIPERLRNQHRAGLAAFLKTGEGPILGKRVEMPALRKNGTELTVELSVVRLPGTQPPTFTGFLRDVTEQKQTEEDLREAVRSRDEFLQIASHELKTPLTPLQLQLDMLARALEKSGGQNERLVAKLETATHQAARLSRLVESLLDVSRITAGRVALEIESLDLSELVHEVVQRFLPEARRAGSALMVDADAPIFGRWDRMRVDQILSNLLTNAIKYGEGKPIEVDARVGNGTVRVSVTDHGIGIEKEAMERIFGRFERAVSLRHFGGLGLGLFIARQFAEAHGGSIVAQSQPHVGSTFSVVLPIEATAQPEAPSPNRGTML